MLDNLENSYKDFLNGKNSEKNKINSDLQTFRENTFKNINKQIADIREDHKKEIDDLRANWEDKKQVVHGLKLKKEKIKHTRFFEKELADFEKEIREYEKLRDKLPIESENLQKQIETIQKQWELDEQNLQKDLERNKEKLEEKTANFEKKITEIESYINNSKDSLYGWLTENYPDWEKSIGQVIDKNVLFNSALNPHFIEKSNNFYGIGIDLEEINKTVKTVADYEKEKTEFDGQIQNLKKEISALYSKIEDDKGKLKTKYQPKIREKRDLIRENNYKFEQAKSKHSEIAIKLNELKNKSETELKS